MYEIQFIRDNNLEAAKNIADAAIAGATFWNVSTQTYKDKSIEEESADDLNLAILRRLVLSVETISEEGGYEAAKKKLRFASWEGSVDPDYVFTPLTQDEYLKLEQAIKDYDALYEGV